MIALSTAPAGAPNASATAPARPSARSRMQIGLPLLSMPRLRPLGAGVSSRSWVIRLSDGGGAASARRAAGNVCGRNEQRCVRRFAGQRFERADRMSLLGEVFEPAVQKGAHAKALLEDAARRPERTDRARKAPIGVAVHHFGHVRIVIHA